MEELNDIMKQSFNLKKERIISDFNQKLSYLKIICQRMDSFISHCEKMENQYRIDCHERLEKFKKINKMSNEYKEVLPKILIIINKASSDDELNKVINFIEEKLDIDEFINQASREIKIEDDKYGPSPIVPFGHSGHKEPSSIEKKVNSISEAFNWICGDKIFNKMFGKK